MDVIEVNDLVKQYGTTRAVDDVSFTVEAGEIFAILGPNGAGKTTTVESIAGLRAPDAGSIRVLGRDPIRDRAWLRGQVGVQLQESQLPDQLRVGEALELFASFYPNPVDRTRLLDDLGLGEKRHVAWKHLSGGQKQRLSIARTLLIDPPILILDDSTSSVDVQTERQIHEALENVVASRTTFVISNRFHAIAQADQILVFKGGRIVQRGTHRELLSEAGEYRELYESQVRPFEEARRNTELQAGENGGVSSRDGQFSGAER
jgi:ABC-2 type transport system ATP-binding protein